LYEDPQLHRQCRCREVLAHYTTGSEPYKLSARKIGCGASGRSASFFTAPEAVGPKRLLPACQEMEAPTRSILGPSWFSFANESHPPWPDERQGPVQVRGICSYYLPPPSGCRLRGPLDPPVPGPARASSQLSGSHCHRPNAVINSAAGEHHFLMGIFWMICGHKDSVSPPRFFPPAR
jgi:hypothetical protein